MKKTLLIPGTCLLAAWNVFATVDFNYNGLSDVYEFIYFNGSADPFAEPDGDGVSNYDEMFWGTNPTNAVSKVTGPTATLNGQTLQFSWPAAPYRYYELRASEDLVTWRTLASGAISNYTENLAAPSAPARRYYRLQVSVGPPAPEAPSLTAKHTGSDLVLTWTMDTIRLYDLLSSGDFATWQTRTTNTTSPHTEFLTAPGTPREKFYRLKVSDKAARAANSASAGLDAWEEALYVQAFGVPPSARDSDGDNLDDLQEFLQGRQPAKKDHPAVGLVVSTPLEK